MARTAKLEPLRRWLEAIPALREALEEADRAEAFLAESRIAVADATERSQRAALEIAALESRRDVLAKEVEAERQRLLVPVRAELKREEDKIASVRATLEPIRRSLEEDAMKLRREIEGFRVQLQDAKRAHPGVLQALRDEADQIKVDLRAEIDVLVAEKARTDEELAKAQRDLNGVVEAAARIGRR